MIRFAGNVWVDDVQVYPWRDYPADYVPGPKPVAASHLPGAARMRTSHQPINRKNASPCYIRKTDEHRNIGADPGRFSGDYSLYVIVEVNVGLREIERTGQAVSVFPEPRYLIDMPPGGRVLVAQLDGGGKPSRPQSELPDRIHPFRRFGHKTQFLER